MCRAGEPGLADKGGWEAELARYLRAEKNNVQKAEKRLREQTVWRTECFPKGEVTEVGSAPIITTTVSAHYSLQLDVVIHRPAMFEA